MKNMKMKYIENKITSQFFIIWFLIGNWKWKERIIPWFTLINQGIICSFHFQLPIKKSNNDKLIGYFAFYYNTKNEKKAIFSHISLLGLDQKYEMEKRAPGQNLILIFNWSVLRDPEVWSGCIRHIHRRRIDCGRACLKRRLVQG